MIDLDLDLVEMLVLPQNLCTKSFFWWRMWLYGYSKKRMHILQNTVKWSSTWLLRVFGSISGHKQSPASDTTATLRLIAPPYVSKNWIQLVIPLTILRSLWTIPAFGWTAQFRSAHEVHFKACRKDSICRATIFSRAWYARKLQSKPGFNENWIPLSRRRWVSKLAILD